VYSQLPLVDKKLPCPIPPQNLQDERDLSLLSKYAPAHSKTRVLVFAYNGFACLKWRLCLFFPCTAVFLIFLIHATFQIVIHNVNSFQSRLLVDVTD
jgi:hypothetical protein